MGWDRRGNGVYFQLYDDDCTKNPISFARNKWESFPSSRRVECRYMTDTEKEGGKIL